MIEVTGVTDNPWIVGLVVFWAWALNILNIASLPNFSTRNYLHFFSQHDGEKGAGIRELYCSTMDFLRSPWLHRSLLEHLVYFYRRHEQKMDTSTGTGSRGEGEGGECGDEMKAWIRYMHIQTQLNRKILVILTFKHKNTIYRKNRIFQRHFLGHDTPLSNHDKSLHCSTF